MVRVDKGKAIATDTVTAFRDWFVILTGGGEMTSVEQVLNKHSISIVD